METSRINRKVLFKTIMVLVAFATFAALAVPSKSYARSILKHPDTAYLEVTSPIVIEFDGPVQWNTSYAGGYYTGSSFGPSAAHPGIRLIELSSGLPVEITMSLDTSKKKLIITPNPAGAVKWVKNKDYRLEITDHIVLDNTGANFLTFYGTSPSITYNISTSFLTFYQLMSGSREINQIIEDYTPRKIRVTAPDRYLEEISVIHKRQEIVQNSTIESVTNIDISFENKTLDNSFGDVKRIEVTPKRNGVAIQSTQTVDNFNITSNTGKKMLDFAYTRLPDTTSFDIEVVLYDSNDIILDKRIVKIPLESKNITTVKQKDRFRYAGRTFTLYDLLNRPSDLQGLLDENRMDEIKVRVVQQ